MDFEETLTSDRMYKCQFCPNKSYHWKHDLQRHEKNTHGSDVGPFSCLLCQRVYKNRNTLQQHHKLVHTGHLF